ncbi:MAG: sigma-54 dependent transcriptional regulator [Archangium sp.]|nr:sigma-54 dependent transcriptional regulator [Archangium sp.]MDP3152279.1 sigma-54 dependent transcriptional regulator [Archangium sp.]MDP3570675.1 sigma-54 dependent transcriptional regulator [Archangium sp.]
MSRRPSLLVVDDDPGIVSWLAEALPEEGFEVRGETNARRALELLTTTPFDLVVSDVEMPGLRGIDLLREIHKSRPEQMVLLVTAFGSIDLAVQAVRSGAVDFLAKPFKLEVLVLAIQRALRETNLKREVSRLREEVARERPRGIAAKSVAMQRAVELVRRAAPSRLPVLITGESGVGKGALARVLHELSDRREGKFVQLNCAALPSGLAEAELFGVRRGAFTDAKESRAGVFEQANGGTLFLDELGELPLDLQPKLLHALESNEVRPVGASEPVSVDVRVVAATNRPLEEALREKRFRPDLYHRLNVVRVELPPLRERRDDIEAIVGQTLEGISHRSGRSLSVSPGALTWLCAQAWPGNVRELINALERASTMAGHELLTAEDFLGWQAAAPTGLLEEAASRELSLKELERLYIQRVLELTGGHKARAAQILGLDRRTLYRKVAEMDQG